MPENYITCQDEKGSINISEDVVAAMVRAAITEVDGVAGSRPLPGRSWPSCSASSPPPRASRCRSSTAR